MARGLKALRPWARGAQEYWSAGARVDRPGGRMKPYNPGNGGAHEYWSPVRGWTDQEGVKP